jgi:hypothetical protein
MNGEFCFASEWSILIYATNSPPLEGWQKFKRIFDGVVEE